MGHGATPGAARTYSSPLHGVGPCHEQRRRDPPVERTGSVETMTESADEARADLLPEERNAGSDNPEGARDDPTRTAPPSDRAE
jgi:hypothetical protein